MLMLIMLIVIVRSSGGLGQLGRTRVVASSYIGFSKNPFYMMADWSERLNLLTVTVLLTTYHSTTSLLRSSS